MSSGALLRSAATELYDWFCSKDHIMLLCRDLCGNTCGLQGQMQCDSMHKDTGRMVIKALDRANVASPANDASAPTKSSYELGMRNITNGNFDSGLFWTYKKSSNGADEVIFPMMISLVSTGTDKRV